MKKYFAVVLLSLSTLAFSQNVERFQFEEEYHDFGVVEEGVMATWKFKFKNIGTDTILLDESSVRPGCGCTKGAYTKTPIAPGDTGSVITIFNTNGRRGSNTKSVNVSYKNTSKVLFFKIVVIAADTAKPTEKQKKKAPVFTLGKESHDFGKVLRGQKVTLKIDVKNTGKDSLTISNMMSACSCVNYKLFVPTKDKKGKQVSSIPAGKSGYIEIEYTPNYNGKGYDIVTFFSNDWKNRRRSIKLMAELVDKL